MEKGCLKVEQLIHDPVMTNPRLVPKLLHVAAKLLGNPSSSSVIGGPRKSSVRKEGVVREGIVYGNHTIHN